jgi:hypothetical protein
MDRDQYEDDAHEAPRGRRQSLFLRFVQFIFDTVLVSIRHNIAIMAHQFDLFFGTALTIIGVLGFQSDKYCDGNTADYLSCTRPSTYYFYDSIDVALVVLGVFFILFWVIKRSR